MIPRDELIIGEAYEVKARNFRIGIWDGRQFHGLRRKFGTTFMDAELHYDLDETYGTARAVRRLT